MKKILYILIVLVFAFSAFTQVPPVLAKEPHKENRLNKKLFKAAEEGNIKKVEQLLNNGADVNAKGDEEKTVLMVAAKGGHSDIIGLLTDKKADVNAKGDDDRTALTMAAWYGHLDIVRLLIKKGADVNAMSNEGWTPLVEAVFYGHITIVRFLIEKGADVNVETKNGWTPLMFATRGDHSDIALLLINKGAKVGEKFKSSSALDRIKNEDVNEIIQDTLKKQADREKAPDDFIKAIEKGNVREVDSLLKAGADVNASGNDGKTPLMVAAKKGHSDIALLLINKGAEVNATNSNGTTALMFFSAHGDVNVVRLLYDKGAKTDTIDKDGWTALARAAEGGHIEVLRALIKAGADVNLQNEAGNTALIKAVMKGQIKVIKELIKKGANVNVEQNDGWTPLMFATQRGNTAVVRVLIKAGARVNAKQNNGWTPIMFAASNGSIETAELLIDSGAEVNAENWNSKTPLTLAMEKDHTDMVKLLRRKGGTAPVLQKAKKHTNRGEASIKQRGDYNEAIKEFKRAVEVAPGTPSVNLNLARACEKAGDYECSVEYYKKYLLLAGNAKDSRAIKRKINKLQNIYKEDTAELTSLKLGQWNTSYADKKDQKTTVKALESGYQMVRVYEDNKGEKTVEWMWYIKFKVNRQTDKSIKGWFYLTDKNKETIKSDSRRIMCCSTGSYMKGFSFLSYKDALKVGGFSWKYQ